MIRDFNNRNQEPSPEETNKKIQLLKEVKYTLQNLTPANSEWEWGKIKERVASILNLLNRKEEFQILDKIKILKAYLIAMQDKIGISKKRALYQLLNPGECDDQENIFEPEYRKHHYDYLRVRELVDESFKEKKIDIYLFRTALSNDFFRHVIQQANSVFETITLYESSLNKKWLDPKCFSALDAKLLQHLAEGMMRKVFFSLGHHLWASFFENLKINIETAINNNEGHPFKNKSSAMYKLHYVADHILNSYMYNNNDKFMSLTINSVNKFKHFKYTAEDGGKFYSSEDFKEENFIRLILDQTISREEIQKFEVFIITYRKHLLGEFIQDEIREKNLNLFNFLNNHQVVQIVVNPVISYALGKVKKIVEGKSNGSNANCHYTPGEPTKVTTQILRYVTYFRYLYFKFQDEEEVVDEVFRYQIMSKLIEYSTSLSEVSLYAAIVALTCLREYIKLLGFINFSNLNQGYKSLVLEQYMLLINIIRIKYNPPSIILFQFYNFIVQNVTIILPFWFTLFRVGLICTEEEAENKPEFVELLNNTSRRFHNMSKVLAEIVPILKDRRPYEIFIYIKLMKSILDENYENLISYEEFKTSLSNIISTFIGKQLTLASHPSEAFFTILQSELHLNLFLIIDKYNLKIPEYFKGVKSENLKSYFSFESFLGKLQTWADHSLCMKDTKKLNLCSQLVAKHYIKIHKIYRKEENKFKELIKDQNCSNKMKTYCDSFLNYQDDASLDFISEIAFLSPHQFYINTSESNRESEIYNSLIKLNNNIKYKYETDKLLIDSLIVYSHKRFQIAKFLICNNLFNLKVKKQRLSENKSISDEIVKLINLLIGNGAKHELLILTFLFRLVDEKVKIHLEKLKDFTMKPMKFVNSIMKQHKDISESSFKSTLEISNSSNLTQSWKTKTAIYIWDDVLSGLDYETFFKKLIINGLYKTCLYHIENVVFREMAKFNVREFKDYENKIYFVYYKDSLAKIENNKHIVSNYILNEDLLNYINSTKIKEDLSDNPSEQKSEDKSEYFLANLNWEESYYIDEEANKIGESLNIVDCSSTSTLAKMLVRLYKVLEASKEELPEIEKDFRYNFSFIINRSFCPISYNDSNFYIQQAYYELWRIFESVVSHKKEVFSDEYTYFDCTKPEKVKDLIKILFSERKLKNQDANLLHLKFRNAILKMFELYDEQREVLKSIIKIYSRTNNIKTNTKLMSLANCYLQELIDYFKENFETIQFDDYKFILKSCVKLKDIKNFKLFYEKPIFRNHEKWYKILFLNFKYLEIIEGGKEFPLRDIDLGEEELLKLYNFHIKRNYTEFVTNGNFLDNSDESERENICQILSHIVKSNEIINNKQLDFISVKEEQICYLIYFLIFICLKSKNEKLLFSNLPKLVNYMLVLYDNYVEYKNRSSSAPKFLEHCEVRLSGLESEYINHIAKNLIGTCSLPRENPIRSLSIKLLSKLVDENIHENAYWLSALLISQLDSQMKNNNRTDWDNLAKLRINFAKDIYNNLKQENQNIINNYKLFQIELDKITLIAKGKGNSKNPIRETIKKINIMLTNPDFKIIIPKMEFIQPTKAAEENNEERQNITNPFSNVQLTQTNLNHNISSIHYQMDAMEIDGVSKKRTYTSVFSKIISDYTDEMFLRSMEEEVTVLPSKDKPIKITFKSKTNIPHNFILKSDEKAGALKEVQAMDVFSTINKVFNYEKLDLKHQIRLKLFSLTPISFCTVIVEWVEKSTTLKSVIEPIYEAEGVYNTLEDAREIVRRNDSNYEKYHKHRQAKGNVLYKKFNEMNSNPNVWYENKKRYIISTAAWSIAGCAIGLNDRHPDNILLRENGEVVHIDFGYLLKWGKKLPVPESVDFRFTDNIRKTLGIFEQDGLFMFYAYEVTKALVKHFDFITTQLECLCNIPGLEEENKKFYNRQLEIIKSEFSKLKDTQLEGLNDIIIRNSRDLQLAKMFFGWQPWI